MLNEIFLDMNLGFHQNLQLSADMNMYCELYLLVERGLQTYYGTLS